MDGNIRFISQYYHNIITILFHNNINLDIWTVKL